MKKLKIKIIKKNNKKYNKMIKVVKMKNGKMMMKMKYFLIVRMI